MWVSPITNHPKFWVGPSPPPTGLSRMEIPPMIAAAAMKISILLSKTICRLSHPSTKTVKMNGVCVCLKMGYTHLYGICLFRNMMLKTSRFRDPMAPWDTLFAGLAHPWCSVVFPGKNISNLPLHGSQVNIPITSKYHEIPSSLVNMNYMRYVSDCTSGLYHNMLQQHGWGFPAFRRNATSLASPSKKWKRGCFLRAAGSGWGRGLGRPSNSQPPGAGEKPHCRGAQSHGTRCHTSRSYPPHRPAHICPSWWNGQASGVPLKPHGGMLGKSTGSHLVLEVIC